MIWLYLLLALLVTVPVGAAGVEADTKQEKCGVDIEMKFENWEEWTKITPTPIISEGHSSNWVGIYVDDLAKEYYINASAPYPECSRIVKPIYYDAAGTTVRKLTIMVKMPAGYDPENGDWWYATYDRTGTVKLQHGKLPDCIPCHKQAAETDYLFPKDVLDAVKELSAAR